MGSFSRMDRSLACEGERVGMYSGSRTIKFRLTVCEKLWNRKNKKKALLIRKTEVVFTIIVSRHTEEESRGPENRAELNTDNGR